ncbi:MAG: hypothetical protein NTY18_14240 [Deltaproteobacteria bacterium]|nr:hypothetical protein [Deltaproteobacteria bacterium]
MSISSTMQTFRMPRDLVSFLKAEATREGRDLTPYVVRLLEGIRSWFGLPYTATSLLEADQKTMKLGHYEYLLHLLFLRSLELREKGPGFDAPKAEKSKGTGR